MKFIIGLLLIIFGGALLADLKTTKGSLENSIAYSFDREYRAQQNLEEFAGYAMVGIGVIFLLSSVLQPPKSKRQSESKSREVKRLFNQATDMYNKEDYSASINKLNQILVIEPDNTLILFNLACCYSLQKNKQALIVLEKAVKNGYSDFNKIEGHKALFWLRTQPEFSAFKANGYTTSPQPIDENNIAVLERLFQLKENGVLTAEEFEKEKKKIIS